MAKYIIIGLGNFGAALAKRLTANGHEVIAADNKPTLVERYKEEVTHTVTLDATDEVALRTLPVRDADACIVTIGEDFGASVMVTALLKQMGANRLIGRVISKTHRSVLEAIQLEELVMPEADSADRLARALDMKLVLSSHEVSEEYSIVEAIVPSRYVGRTLQEAEFRKKYNLNIVTVKKRIETQGSTGIEKKDEIMGVVAPDYKFEKGDILVLFGRDRDMERILGG